MNTEDKVTSLELSKKLRDAGCKQESEWCWGEERERQNGPVVGIKLYDKRTASARRHNSPDLEQWSAFCCAELLERLPRRLEVDDVIYWLGVHKWGSMIRPFTAEYSPDRGGELQHSDGPIPAEALGKLYLFCLENGHCNE